MKSFSWFYNRGVKILFFFIIWLVTWKGSLINYFFYLAVFIQQARLLILLTTKLMNLLVVSSLEYSCVSFFYCFHIYGAMITDFTLFLLTIWWRRWLRGKRLSSGFKKYLTIFLYTFLLKGRLNQIIFFDDYICYDFLF